MLQWCRRRLTNETLFRTTRLRPSSDVRRSACHHRGGVRSVERGDGVTSLSRSALSRSRRYFRGISRSIGFFKGAFLLAFKWPQLSFFYEHDGDSLSVGKLVPSVAPDAITPRVTRLIAVPPSRRRSSGHSVVHARAPRRASGRRRRALGLPPGSGAGGAARAAHPSPARVPVGGQGEQGRRDVLGGAAVETVRPHKQDHLPRRGGEAHVQRARYVTGEGPARDVQPPIEARRTRRLFPLRDDRFNKYALRLFPPFFADSRARERFRRARGTRLR